MKRLVDHLQQIIDTFPEKSVCMIDTRRVLCNSLKLNMQCDPELNKYQILRRIPPGNDIIVCRNTNQQLLQESFADVYMILDLHVNENHDGYKQCVETFLLMRNRVYLYHCMCPSRSSKYNFLF